MNKLLVMLAFVFTAPVFADYHTESMRTIAPSASEIRPLLPGMMVSDTCVQDMNREEVCSDRLFQQKPTVLVVYRGGWCPYCNAQLNRLKQIEKHLITLGYQLVAVSPDSNVNVDRLQRRHSLRYTLLTDNKLALAKSMGLAYFLDKKMEALYKEKFGVPYVDIEGETRVSLPVPAVYIIDTTGLIHFQYVNPNHKLRLDEKLLLTAAERALIAMDI